MSLRIILRAPLKYLLAWGATSEDPQNMSHKKRQYTAQLVLSLAKWLGPKTLVSSRQPFSRRTASQSPQTSGVYRFYDGDELKYIGMSKKLRQRLIEHLNSRQNEDLARLIASGRASVEWYVCPLAGWMECYEHTEYLEKYGHLPPFNRIRCGNRWK